MEQSDWQLQAGCSDRQVMNGSIHLMPQGEEARQENLKWRHKVVEDSNHDAGRSDSDHTWRVTTALLSSHACNLTNPPTASSRSKIQSAHSFQIAAIKPFTDGILHLIRSILTRSSIFSFSPKQYWQSPKKAVWDFSSQVLVKGYKHLIS